jgi:hypothetical protein
MMDKDKALEPIDIVIPFGKGSEWDNNELRYSLRSIEKNMVNFRNIYIVGDVPDWAQNVIHIPFKDGKNHDENIKNKVLAACMEADITKEFLQSSDDYFFLQKTDAADYPYYKNGTLSHTANTVVTGWYKTNLINTSEALKEQRKYTDHFDVHTPIRYNKHLFPVIMKRFFTQPKMVVKSIYCNALNIKGSHINDCKVRVYMVEKDFLTFIENKPMFSTGDYCLMDTKGQSPIKSFLEKTFPSKSRYEK